MKGIHPSFQSNSKEEEKEHSDFLVVSRSCVYLQGGAAPSQTSNPLSISISDMANSQNKKSTRPVDRGQELYKLLVEA